MIRNHEFFINSFPVLLSELTLIILLGFIGGGVFVTKQRDEITLGTQINNIHNYIVILNILKLVFETLYHKAQLTYLLTPWSRVLLEKLSGSAVSQEIPRIFGTRKFITVLTSARHLSLSWANSFQSSQPPPTSWRSILIPQVSPPEPCAPLSPPPYAPHARPISFFSILPPAQYSVRSTDH